MLEFHGYLPFILKGLVVTLEVALLSLALAVALGVLGAAARLSSVPPLRWAASIYTTVIRGVPDLVLMTIIFFGGQILVNEVGDRLEWEYIEISAFVAGVGTIGFIFGAYMAETFRGAILSVPRGEIEAARAFGMRPLQVFTRVTFPACVRHALPGLGNNWMVLVKTTALVSVIGLHDMVFNAGQAGGATRQPFTFYMVVAALFLAITSASDLVLRWLNRRYSVGVRYE